VRLCVWWLYKNKVKNIFSRGNEKDFIQRAQQWWNFNNSKLSKKTFFAKMLVGKYEISKSRGRFKTFLNKITTCQPASFQCSANPRLVLFICYSASDVWLWRRRIIYFENGVLEKIPEANRSSNVASLERINRLYTNCKTPNRNQQSRNTVAVPTSK